MKKILSLVLAAVMLISMLPVMAQGENKVTVTFAAYDSTNYQFVYMPAELEVAAGTAAKYGFENSSAYVGENQITVMDAFVAAHESLYNAEQIQSMWDGLSLGFVTKMFGQDGNISFMVNDKFANDGFSRGYAINEAVINNGDAITFYTYADAMWMDYYSYFDVNKKEVAPDESFELTLNAFQPAELMWANPGDPTPETLSTLTTVAGASVVSLDATSGALDKPLGTTNENGIVTLSFAEEGTYYVSATAMIDGMYGTVPMIAPCCKIIVKAPTNYYNVTVKVAPSTANVKFYSCDGFDENKKDIIGEEITASDGGVVEKYHQYNLMLKEGRYSFRGETADGASLGGMAFTVPPADAAEATEYEITLRQVDVYTTTKYDGTSYATENEYTTTVKDYEENFATAGAPYKKGNYTRYPYLLCALGNPFPYSIEIIPDAETAESYSLGTNTMLGYAVSAGTSIATKSGAIPTLLNAVINAPAGAKVQVFKQIKNFYRQEVEYSSATESENGTVDYTYRLPKDNSSHTYRASMESKITKAGFLSLKTEETAKTTVTFAENEDPKIRPEYDRSTPMGKRCEDSIILNINKQNYLRLNQEEEFTARAYRAVQIINSDTANIMIEPDFHYSIISGDSVTLEQQGHKAVLKAVKEGISIIEVTYDAIEVTGSASYSGLYGAIDPSRKGLFVVNVGGDTSTTIDMTEWDSEFDTVYFLGESGTFSFAPAADAPITVEADGTGINSNADGTYNIPVKQGNNIISVTSGDTTEYIVVKGNKVTAKVRNVTTPNSPIKQGDTVQVSFDGLHTPVPKMGGIYNPGYKSTIKAEYTMPDKSTVASKGAQYDFISNHTITFTVYDEGTLKLTGGSIPMTCMGFDLGAHRYITDTGVPANFNAAEIPGRFSLLPDIEIPVLKADKITLTDTILEDNTAYLTFASPDETTVDIFLSSYDDISLDGILYTKGELKAGKTTVTVDYSSLSDKDNLYMLVWDKDMTEITDKTSTK